MTAIFYIDLSSYFNDYQGCFVLFDATTDSWQIYNKVMAQKRISPDSTYKIYSALLGLENRYITLASSENTGKGKNPLLQSGMPIKTLLQHFKTLSIGTFNH